MIGLILNLMLLILVMTLAVMHVKRERIENPRYTVGDWIWHFIGLLLLGLVVCVVLTIMLLPLGISILIIIPVRILACFVVGWFYPRYPYKKKGT